MTPNDSNCNSFINSTSQLIVSSSVYGASTFIGEASALIAIVLILVAKVHKDFIYRLLLYMAVAALPGLLATLAYNIEIDYRLQYDIAMPTNLVMTYLIYVYDFLLFWLGLYLFSLAVFRVQLKKPKHEVIGLVTVLVTPLTFLWVFPWKARKTLVCEDTYSLAIIKLVFFYNIPNVSVILLSTIFIGAVLMILCKNAVNRAENTLQQQHRKAVRETIPLVVFVIAHQISALMVFGVLACQLYIAVATKNKRAPVFVWEMYHLWPITVISLPILLLSQPRIRHRIKCRKSPMLATDNERATIIHHSSGIEQPSYSYYSIPHESSCTFTE